MSGAQPPARPADPQGVTLAACLIVRDAATTLPRCLAGLAGRVDELIVHDTGSTDGSREIARSLGARVLEGHWDDDFARARNGVLAAASADWVLSLDADEQALLDRPRLDAVLAAPGTPALLAVEFDDHAPVTTGTSTHSTVRLFRRAGARWVGRVHEWVEHDAGERWAPCDPAALRLAHDGYADPVTAAAKAARNVRIGWTEVEQLRADPDTAPARLARAVLDLGRSLVAAGDPTHAVPALEAARLLAPGTGLWARATDHLARVRLQQGEFAVAEELAGALRDWGADPRYCDWLVAQALAQTGRPARAAALLAGIDALHDPAGHRLDLGQVLELLALAHALSGDPAAALPAMLAAMAGHGRIAGRGELVRGWWGAGSMPDLLAELHRTGGRYTAQAERELLGG